MILRAVALSLLLAAAAGAQCVGDCTNLGRVRINDLILGVNMALGETPSSACLAFAGPDGKVTIVQLIQAVNNAQAGCPEPEPTCVPECV